MSSLPFSNSASSTSGILGKSGEVLDAILESEMAPTPPQISSPSICSTPPSPPSGATDVPLHEKLDTLYSSPPSQPHFISRVQVKGNRLSVQLPQNRSCKVKRYNVALGLPSSKSNDKSVEASVTRVDLVDDGTTSEYCVGHCTVCLVRRCDCVFLPCGHIKTCMKCGTNLYLRRMKCPICRNVIKLRPYKVYM